MDDLDEQQRVLIPHPLRELTLHCIYKGLQLGSTVTIATALPYQLYKSRRNPSLIHVFSRVGTATIYGSIGGVLLSVGMMHLKLYGEEYNKYKIWDRSYRLRYSQSQQRVDKYTFISSIFGGLTAFIIGLPRKLNSISLGKGSLMSIPFGLIIHVISKPLQQPPMNKNEK